MSEKAVRVTVSGRVQGVFYRNWTVENARGLNLRGWVRNVGDGSVDALLCGAAADVDTMLLRMEHGPQRAEVSGVTARGADESCPAGFKKRPTVDSA